MSSLHDPDAVPLPSSVTWATRSLLPRLDVTGRHGAAQIYLHGAHLAAWQPSQARGPVLWMSAHSFFRPDKPIRGGVPICFPWFGPHREDRTVPAVNLTLQLEDDNASSVWPHYFHADLRLSIGRSLTLALFVDNPDSIAFSFEEALHTYFSVSNIEEVSVSGLENTEYLDKVAGSRQRQGPNPIRFSGETDRVYLDTQAPCTIHDPGMNRRITITKHGSASTVVWNPWVQKARAMADFGDDEWPGMLCIETANVGDAAVTLRPGDSHTMTAEISVEAAE
jgi:glucose-6-phosphate 1-epimerase